MVATKLALGLSDYVVTEAGFGADLGAEKFVNIKCRSSGLAPDVAVVVATVRALKEHGGPKSCLQAGMDNLKRHVKNLDKFGTTAITFSLSKAKALFYMCTGIPSIVALNTFSGDSEAELEEVQMSCHAADISVVRTDHHAQGSAGAEQLASAVVEVEHRPRQSPFRYLYPDSMPLRDKVETVRVACDVLLSQPDCITFMFRWHEKFTVQSGLRGLPARSNNLTY